MASIFRAVRGNSSMKQMSSGGTDHHHGHGIKFPGNLSKLPFLRGRHKKLGEGWGVNKEPVEAGVTFYLKYLGSTLVEELNDDGKSYGEGISSEAVKRVVTLARSRGSKLQKVSLYVSPSGIKMFDLVSNELIRELTVDRIRFCTADSTHEKVFAFIARNTDNETMECSAFLCAKKKMAQAVTLSVAQAFQIAYEIWEKDKTNTKSVIDTNHTQQRRFSADNNLFEIKSPNSGNCATNGGLNEEPLLSFNTPQPVPATDRQIEQTFARIPAPASSSPASSSTASFLPLIQPMPAKNCPSSAHNAQPGIVMNNRQNWVSFDDEDSAFSSKQKKSQNPFYFGTNLTTDDIDDGVEQFLDGSKSREEFSRQKSLEDLLDL